MDSKESPGLAWLEKNHSVIRWRVIGPNVRNPFDSASSDQKLETYASDRSTLMEACQVQAAMDDTILIKITDLSVFKFSTEHPYLVDLSREDLRRYLDKSGIAKMIQDELSKLQQACRDELKNRTSR